jgi:peptide/nickel transport system permease protein
MNVLGVAVLPWWQAPPKLVLLWTDLAVWVLAAAVLGYVVWLLRHPERAALWARVFRSGPALASSIVLLGAVGITLLDSVHLRLQVPAVAGAQGVAATAVPVYDTRSLSLLDLLLAELPVKTAVRLCAEITGQPRNPLYEAALARRG